MPSPLKNMSDNDRTRVKVLTAGGAASSSAPTRRGADSRSGGKKNSVVARKRGTTAVPSKDETVPADLQPSQTEHQWQLEIEESTSHEDVDPLQQLAPYSDNRETGNYSDQPATSLGSHSLVEVPTPSSVSSKERLSEPLPIVMENNHGHNQPLSLTASASNKKTHELLWLFACFCGIMFSFVCYGLLLEYTTSGGRKLHELSFLFVTSGLYTLTAAAGRYVRDETPTTIPPARFAVLGLTSMGSTFCSVRSLRYVCNKTQCLSVLRSSNSVLFGY